MAADPELIVLFAHGWALTHGVAPPEPRHGGLYVEVGEPDQKARYFFPAFDPNIIAELARTIREPWIYLKICDSPDKVRAALPQGWIIREPETWIMTCAIVPAIARIPQAYTLSIEETGTAVLQATIRHGNEAVAGGRIGLLGETVLFDHIVTDEAHRRKGLGRSVMQALSNAALDRGAYRGLLSATEMGRALYQTIGWAVHAPYTSAVIPG